MVNKQIQTLLSHLQRLESTLADQHWTDAQVLERFVAHGEEAAFRLLLQRHGPMVLAVCRRILHDAHAAEDAFQAAFLVLALKAGSVRRETSLGSWLYRVACRIALNERSRACKQRSREREVAEMARRNAAPAPACSELRQALDEELSQLPEKYRAPLVLCLLEGKTHEEAARELHWPLGSMSRRLERAKQLLQTRLVRRGLALSVAGLMQALTVEAAPAALPATLLATTAQTVGAVAAGSAVHGLVSARIALMIDGAVRTLVPLPLKIAGFLLLASGLVSVAFAAVWWQQAVPAPPTPTPTPTTLPQPVAVPAQASIKLFLLAGQANMEGVLPLRPETLPDRGASFAAENVLPGAPVLPGDREVLLASFSYDPALHFKWLTLADRPAHQRLGPELGLGRALQAGLPGQRIALFKYAVGDSNIRDWSREDHSDAYWKTGYQLYPKFLQHLASCLAELTAQGNTVEVAGLFWSQGEDPFALYDSYLWNKNPTDPGAWAFARATHQVFTDLRADVGKLVNQDGKPAQFPVILARLSKAQQAAPLLQAATAISGKPVEEHLATVEHRRREQIYLTERLNPDRSIYWVDTDDLTMYPPEPGQRRVACRFLPSSYRLVGQRFAQAYLTRANVVLEPADLPAAKP